MLQRPTLSVLFVAGFTFACQQAAAPSADSDDDSEESEVAAEEAESDASDASVEGEADDPERGELFGGSEEDDEALEPEQGVDASAEQVPQGGRDAGWADGSVGPGPSEFSFSPSNMGVGTVELAGAPAAVLDCGEVRIDSSLPVKFDNWCGIEPVTFAQRQENGPELLVIPLASLTVESGARLVLTGDRPVVFLVSGEVAIRGAIDASANLGVPGAGGDFSCAASKGGDGAGREGRNGGGGGGGGFGSAGGAGGDDDERNSEPGLAGAPRGNAELSPLLGGCGGGHGGGCAGTPGAGAGAFQISAAGSLLVSGELRANGGVGARGCDDSAGGTGGGSGGGILLEAQAITVTGAKISAAGGSGGPGQDEGNPGAGSSKATVAGGAGAADGDGAGAGGGGFGRIQLRSATTCSGC